MLQFTCGGVESLDASSCKVVWVEVGVMVVGGCVGGGCGVEGGSLDCAAVARELEVDSVMMELVSLVAKEVLSVMVMSWLVRLEERGLEIVGKRVELDG